MFPAKEAPASSHMLVSRAERGLQATIWSSIPSKTEAALPSVFDAKKACFLQVLAKRKLLPVGICLSHGLVSRAERGLQATIWSSSKTEAGRTSEHFWCKKGLFSSSSCETACFLPRKLLPVVICLSQAEQGLQATIWSLIPSKTEAERPSSAKKLARSGFSQSRETWLILPVVIRLSHGLSCSKKKKEVSGSIPSGVRHPQTNPRPSQEERQ